MNENYKSSKEEGENINSLEIIYKYLSYWKWVVLSLLISFLCAFFYLRFSTPVYRVYSTILVKDDTRGGASDELSTLQSWGIMRGIANNVDNEMEMLNSWNLSKLVINELKLHTIYYYKDRFRNVELYKKSPIIANLSQHYLDTLSAPIIIQIKKIEDGRIAIEGQQDNFLISEIFSNLPERLNFPGGEVSFLVNHDSLWDDDRVLTICIYNPTGVALSWRRRLGIATTSKTTTVIELSIRETIPERGVDFINKLIDIYNREGVDDKNRSALSMGVFIEARLEKITQELNEIKLDLELYKRTEKITELKINSDLSLQANSQYQRELVKISTQLNMVKFLQEYMTENVEIERLVPANLGINDPVLQSLVVEYNKNLQERDRMLRASSRENPNVITLTHSIKALHKDILNSISGIQQGLLVTKKDLDTQTRRYDNLIGSVPKQERELAEKMRNQKVLEDLYIILSRRKEENALTLAVPVSKAKVIDDAISSGSPIAPRSKIIFLIALVLGLVVPIIGVYLYDLLNFRIRTRKDLEQLSKVPIIGEIPINDTSSIIAVKEGLNNSMAEAFRAIRTNLLFGEIIKKQVIMVTSAMPGEGKTFVALNLAISLATLNKKVLLIGLDIRKPVLGKLLNLNSKKGVTSYVAGIQSDISSLIQPSGIHSNLEVLTSGIVPPNPAELLQSERLDEMIKLLCRQYDFIIIDSAPVGLVTDSIIIGRIATTTLFVTRMAYTHKRHLNWLNEINNENKLPSISVVMNAVEFKKSTRFGTGYGFYGTQGPE